MYWKKMGMLTAAGALLLVGGCDASVGAHVSAAQDSSQAAVSAGVSQQPSASETVCTESAAAQPVADDDAAGLPQPDQDGMTVSFLGTLTELDPAEHYAVIAEGEDVSVSAAVQAQLSEKTLIIDAQSGHSVAEADLTTGQRASAAVSPMLTRSIPPQAQAYALIVNLPENGLGAANYIQAMDVMTAENGDTIVLNQNADLYVTIPAALTVEKLDSEETVPASDIKRGSVLIAWYDAVAESYPAQATATRVVLAS